MLMTIFENKWLTVILLPFSWLYGLIMWARNKFYDLGIFTSYRVSTRVICVGNLTVGGTGKTPVVAALATLLAQETKKTVVILSRGYRRETTGTVIVSDGKQVLAAVKEAGDEPFMLAHRLKTVPVICDEDRVRGARIAIKQFQADYVILDDGFQHRRLRRDVDLMIMNAAHGFGNRHLLPAGPLREQLSGMQRAQAIVINNLSDLSMVDYRKKYLPDFSGLLISTHYRPNRLVAVYGDMEIPLTDLSQYRIMGFSGIANPERFSQTLQGLQIKTTAFECFPDHHDFSITDFDLINQKSQESATEILITTEKDAVRLPGESVFEKPVFYLEMALELHGQSRILQLIHG